MSRKQVVSLTSTILLTSAILTVALITNIAGWIHDAKAHPSTISKQNVTHVCVDTDHGSQSDVCQTVQFTLTVEINPNPHPANHDQNAEEKDVFLSTGVTSCSQCPNPPFDHYN